MYHHNHVNAYILLLSTIATLTSFSHAAYLPRRSTPPLHQFTAFLTSDKTVDDIISFKNATTKTKDDFTKDFFSLKEKTVCIRGGSKPENESKIVVKLRNIVRSIVRIGERKSPSTMGLFKRCINVFERLLGIDLLTDDDEIVSELERKTKKKKGKEKTDSSVGSSTQATKSTNKKVKSSSTLLTTRQPSKSAAANNHLKKALKTTSPNYRIQRELKQFLSSPPPNLSLKVGKNIRVWIVTLTFPPNTVYHGEKYRLRIQFPSDYPSSPPSVYFLQPTPRHEHVYTNGDICLSLLGKDWRPTMTAQSVAMSISSILSGAQRKSLPMDNVAHSVNKPGGKQDDWVYHDDNC